MTLWLLAWPIFIEQFLQFLLGAADTLMVSRISDDAVAVVGFSNQLFFALQTLFMTIASGAGILIAQKLGSRKNEDARVLGIMAVSVSAAIGIVLSLILVWKPVEIAQLLNMPENLLPLAKIYISIVGGGMVLTALMAALGTAIRNTGNTKGPMYTAIGMNVIHIILNYAFIYGAFGFPQWGLTGVAISTLVSRLLASIFLYWLFIQSFDQRIKLRDFKIFDRKLFNDILKIGWPLGVNSSCWVFTQLIIFTFIAMLGSKELATRTYMNTLESFCFLLGFSIALAVQIQIAHLFGARQTKEAYKGAYKALVIGLILVTVNAFLVFVLGKSILSIFTNDPEIIAMAGSLLLLNLMLQPGKMLNMALGNALNAVGDTKFPMWTAIFSMWLIATALSYYLGIEWGWGLVGIYVCMIADEYVRGLLALWRWRQRKHLKRAEASMTATTLPGSGAMAIDS
ncbi:MATE family efflux transporter [Paenibacillus sp. 1001270B_150601_E10]|uniref:MATE family efflux transporter n=1 Tax=Paenibacillus sp. 1001270B_150601_E10 TaxID=2787079 RepID=UPI00189FD39E|nr:MATE family efflux transporter [Paenibacillus sp. 1001270B_150601_E10]